MRSSARSLWVLGLALAAAGSAAAQQRRDAVVSHAIAISSRDATLELDLASGKSRVVSLRDGDVIELNVPARKLNVRLSAAELAARKKRWKPAVERKLTGWLSRYAKLVGDASTGASLIG